MFPGALPDVNDEFSFGAALILLFALCIGHALADFPLQGSFLAAAKDRHNLPPGIPPDDPCRNHIWVHALTAHCLIHAGFVWLITGSWALGLFEFVAHWIIDLLKCEGVTTFDVDQALHILTKILFVVLIWQGFIDLGQ